MTAPINNQATSFNRETGGAVSGHMDMDAISFGRVEGVAKVPKVVKENLEKLRNAVKEAEGLIEEIRDTAKYCDPSRKNETKPLLDQVKVKEKRVKQLKRAIEITKRSKTQRKYLNELKGIIEKLTEIFKSMDRLCDNDPEKDAIPVQ